MTTQTIPNVGQRIIVRANNGNMPTRYLGTEQTVTSTDEGTYYTPGSLHDTGYGMRVFFSPGPGERFYTTEWDIVTPLIDATPMTPEQLDEKIVDLTNELNRWKSRAEIAESRVQDAYRCMEIIGSRLISESESRGWCDEFDRIIDEVNSDLPGPFELEVRSNEYEVTWTETYTVTVHRATTITARSEEDAIAEARDYDTAETHDLREAIANGQYEYDDADDYEASVI